MNVLSKMDLLDAEQQEALRTYTHAREVGS